MSIDLLKDNAEQMLVGTVPVGRQELPVLVDKSPLFTDLAKILVRDIRRIAPPQADLPSVEMMEGYLYTLLALRVLHVSGHPPRIGKADYRGVVRTAMVPSFVSVIFVNLGIACDPENGITFRPYIDVKVDHVLSPEQMNEFSSILRSFESYGLAIVQGLPKDLSGDIAFMAMQWLDTPQGVGVCSYRKDHPVFAVMASVISMFWSDALGKPFGSEGPSGTWTLRPPTPNKFYGAAPDFQGLLWSAKF